MAQYRKKPVVIEAIQLTVKNIHEVYSFIYGKPDTSSFIAGEKWQDYEKLVKREGMRLKTIESHNETQIASIGDFIIKGVAPMSFTLVNLIFLK